MNYVLFHPPRLHASSRIVYKKAKRTSDYLFIFCHGSADSSLHVEELFETYPLPHVDQVCFAYPGFDGDQRASLTIERNYVSWIEQCVEAWHWSWDRVIVCGYSIGSVPAIALASRHRVGHLGLIAPFLSILAVAQDKVGSAFWWPDYLPNHLRMSSITCPVTCLHGQQDKLIDYYHSYRLLFNASKSSQKRLLLYQERGHDSCASWYPEIVKLL